MAAGDEADSALTTVIDENYEFSAPQFFDFINGESEECQRRVELWFETALGCAPSPCIPRIKTGRSIDVESLCTFSEVEKMQKAVEGLNSNTAGDPKSQSDSKSSEIKEEEELNQRVLVVVPNQDETSEDCKTRSSCTEQNPKSVVPVSNSIRRAENILSSNIRESAAAIPVEGDVSTPNPTLRTQSLANSKKQTAKKIACLVKNPSALKPKSRLQSSQSKNNKPCSVKRDTSVQNVVATANLAQENQAIKRQKLEEGRSRQILNIKPPNLQHKSKLGLTNGSSINSSSSTANKTKKEDRKIYVRDPATPFVSAAEMMQKFQSSTRDLSLPHVNINMKPKLTLTRPKEPELETAQRVRSVKVKSTAELEEEMMAKMPKFKAIPLNKRILKAPTFPTIPRSTLQLPEFQEFHLETEARANQAAESSSITSTELHHQNNKWKPHLTEPKSPVLQTLLRARPPRVKSSFELEQEELEKIPKFTARPLNKKIFESKGELGLFVADLFSKLALSAEPRREYQFPKNTKPNPFHLHTEERGAEKERRFFEELNKKEREDKKARIPKANPYPYTTEYPVIPAKPEPKPCTKPEPFQLESLVRHEEEMQKELEEKQRREKAEAEMRIFKAQPIIKEDPIPLPEKVRKPCTKPEPFQLESLVRHEEEMQKESEEKQWREKAEAEMRIFKAQPIIKEDPIPLPEKVRKPLTQVQSFNLQVDHRAVEREEFDQKIKEKEMIYKRYRDESEAARLVEEEKALKQMRRTMVPHARPVPNFGNPFLPQKSCKETTKAKSPNLRVLQRKRTQKLMRSAISGAASQMR